MDWALPFLTEPRLKQDKVAEDKVLILLVVVVVSSYKDRNLEFGKRLMELVMVLEEEDTTMVILDILELLL